MYSAVSRWAWAASPAPRSHFPSIAIAVSSDSRRPASLAFGGWQRGNHCLLAAIPQAARSLHQPSAFEGVDSVGHCSRSQHQFFIQLGRGELVWRSCAAEGGHRPAVAAASRAGRHHLARCTGVPCQRGGPDPGHQRGVGDQRAQARPRGARAPPAILRAGRAGPAAWLCRRAAAGGAVYQGVRDSRRGRHHRLLTEDFWLTMPPLPMEYRFDPSTLPRFGLPATLGD